MIQNIKTILAPVDFSDLSLQAMRGAWELAQDLGAQMHVVYVVAPLNTFVPLPLATDAERTREIAREAAMVAQVEEELARIKKAELDDSKNVSVAVLKGSPVEMLIEYARGQNVDLIALATHGRTGAQHILIGSVAEKLARLAPCSVLVMRRRRV